MCRWSWAPLHRLQAEWCEPALSQKALFTVMRFCAWVNVPVQTHFWIPSSVFSGYCLDITEKLSFINGQKLNPPKWSNHCWRVIWDCDRDKAVGEWAEETHTMSKNSLCHVTTCSFDIWIYGLKHKWPKASFIWTRDRNSNCPTELSFMFQVWLTG